MRIDRVMRVREAEPVAINRVKYATDMPAKEVEAKVKQDSGEWPIVKNFILTETLYGPLGTYIRQTTTRSHYA